MNASVLIVVLFALVLAGVTFFLLRRGQAAPEKPDRGAYLAGLLALLRGQQEQAFIKLREAVNADSDNVDAYIRLGSIFRQRKQPDQALRLHRDLTFRRNLTVDEKTEILKALYYDFIELKDDASAIKAVSEILEYSGNDRFALEALLRYHEKTGDWKEAAVVRRKLDRSESQNSQKTLALYKTFEGEELGRKGEHHRARLFYKEAIHLDKGCLAAYINLGDSYFAEGRIEEALEYWGKVITVKPEMSHVVFERLKKGFFEIGRYGEYADTLATLLQVCPDHLAARLELAYFLEKKGETEAAREHYVNAHDSHPDSLLARLGLYRLNRDARRREAADTYFKQIVQMAVKKEAGSYRCKVCGMEVQSIAWLCLRCRAIDSFEPVKA